MASGKHARHERKLPTFYLMVTALIFIAFCLIVVWVFSSSPKSSVEHGDAIPSDTKGTIEERSSSYSQPFEGSTGDLQQDSEVRVDSSSSTVSDSVESNASESSSDKDYGNKKTASLGRDDEPSDNSKSSDKISSEDKNVTGDEGQFQNEVADDEDEFQEEDHKQNTLGEKQKGEEEGKMDASMLVDLPAGGEQPEILMEYKETTGDWSTQATESKEEKEIDNKESFVDGERKKNGEEQPLKEMVGFDKRLEEGKSIEQNSKDMDFQDVEIKSKEVQFKEGDSGPNRQLQWELCNGTDYIPCLDNTEAIQKLPSTKHYEHRERHCPKISPTCLVPMPKGYYQPLPWPQSRKEVWYSNVPHPGLVSYKKDQNWVIKKGSRLVFPGGGTQFTHGALHYIEFIEKTLKAIAWGRRTRIVLDVGCGVASFGGYLFEKNVHTMSFAPKDEHEAQVQLALERGIPALSAVMGTQRLVFPSNVYDVVHCARCRVPWHIEGGKLLLELNRVLRPGGYFVWSATPIYRKGNEDVSTWKAMVVLTAAMCWNLVSRTTDQHTGVGIAIFQKPTNNFCYEHRKINEPPLCEEVDEPDAAWYVKITACLHRIPTNNGAHGADWPEDWPQRLEAAPVWLNNSKGLYGKVGATDFRTDSEHWQRVVERSYLKGLGIDWNRIRNVMDMKAAYGGFAAALATQQVWVMNIVPIDAPDTLPVIFDRGFFGIYHDWCESLSTYPRTYDLLHADHLFGKLKKRCNILATVVEMDRILRPEGWAIFRDKVDVLNEIEVIIKSLHWDIRLTYSQDKEGFLVVQKRMWRPEAKS
eukprot:c27264_g1_i1 orf=476-2908(-)